jgi:UPF0755 protein
MGSATVIREIRKPEPIPNYVVGERSSETTVVIPSGATGDQIAQILFDAGVVKSARAFFAAATANPQSQGIQPGTYMINTKIPGSEAVLQLLDRDRRSLVLLIKEGERTYEIGESLTQLKFKPREIEVFLNQRVDLPGFRGTKSRRFSLPRDLQFNSQ